MNVFLYNQQKDLKVSLRAAKKLVQEILAFEKVETGEISICFVSQKRICELHKQFFDDPTPTDCISFPLDEETLGEVFVCPKAALDYCAKKGGDPYEETALYIVHGILHLLGYDDLEPGPRRVMRKKEKKCMAHLKSLNLKI